MPAIYAAILLLLLSVQVACGGQGPRYFLAQLDTGASAARDAARLADVQAYIPFLMPLNCIQPVVPKAAKNIQGSVRLLLTIDEGGKVTQAEVLSGPEALRQPSLDAAKRQLYRPVIRNGHPVRAYIGAFITYMVEGKEGEGWDRSGENAEKKVRVLEGIFPRSRLQVLADLEQDAGTDDEDRRFYVLPDLAGKAFIAGALDKAAAYANELLSAAPKHRHDENNYGNAIHDGNMVLGLLAVRQGDTNLASRYLLDAGRTPGSPRLNIVGPDMALAKELLEKGERDSVLEYFALCRKFWEMGTRELDDWTETVRSGGKPDFTLHLLLEF